MIRRSNKPAHEVRQEFYYWCEYYTSLTYSCLLPVPAGTPGSVRWAGSNPVLLLASLSTLFAVGKTMNTRKEKDWQPY